MGVPLPSDIVYDHTTVQSLAAALYRLKISAAKGDAVVGIGGEEIEHGVGGEGGEQAAGMAPSLPLPLVVAEASELVRDGELKRAAAICERAVEAAGLRLPSWEQRVALRTIADVADSPMVPPAPEPVLMVLTLAHAPLLLLLIGVWARLGRSPQAATACELLIGLYPPGVRGVDVALLYARLAVLRDSFGETTAAKAAFAAAALAAAAPGGSDVVGAEQAVVGGVRCDVGCTRRAIGPQMESCTPPYGATALASTPPSSHSPPPQPPLAAPWCAACAGMHTLVLRQLQLRVLPDCLGLLSSLQVSPPFLVITLPARPPACVPLHPPLSAPPIRTPDVSRTPGPRCLLQLTSFAPTFHGVSSIAPRAAVGVK